MRTTSILTSTRPRPLLDAVQRVLTPKDWEAYCKAEDSPLLVLHEDSEATSASDVMTKVSERRFYTLCIRCAAGHACV